jgi:hypothetical protein
VTSSGTAESGRDRREDPLLLLRAQAMTSEAAVKEDVAAYEEAARRHAADAARKYKRDIFYVDEVDAERIADKAWSKAVASYGSRLEKADSVSAVLTTIARQCVVDEHRRGTVLFRGRQRPLDEAMSIGLDAPAREFSTSGTQASQHEFVRDEDDVAHAVERGQATAEARRRLPGLREEARQLGTCPFHMETGCPHGDRVIDFLAKYVVAGQMLDEAERGMLSEANGEGTPDAEASPGITAGEVHNRQVRERLRQAAAADDLLEPGEFERRLIEEGRQLGVPVSGRRGTRGGAGQRHRTLSTADQTLNRHFRHCIWWWSYRAFKDTTADETHVGKLLLRWRLISLLRLKPGGTWDSSTCPKEGAMRMLATDSEFGRLLLRLHEVGQTPHGAGTYKDIHDFLEGGPTDGQAATNWL